MKKQHMRTILYALLLLIFLFSLFVDWRDLSSRFYDGTFTFETVKRFFSYRQVKADTVMAVVFAIGLIRSVLPNSDKVRREDESEEEEADTKD